MGSTSTKPERVEAGVSLRTFSPEKLNASVDELKKLVTGSVTLPGESGYDHARRAWNKDAAGFPSCVVTCADIADVRAVVKFASENCLPLGVTGAGRHSHMCSPDNTLLCDLSLINKIIVNPDSKVAKVGGGAQLVDLDLACEPHNLATTAGANPWTGVGGLTLGGGVGILSRSLGLTVDNVLSMEVVLATGELVTCNENTLPELFWALRGGGGNFGVVVEFTLRLHPIPEQIMGGSRVYLPVPFLFAKGRTVLGNVRDFIESDKFVNELGGVIVLPCGGPVITAWAYNGTLEDGKAQFAKPEMHHGRTMINQVAPMKYHTQVQRMSLGPDGMGQQSGYYYEKGHLFRRLSDEALDIILAAQNNGPNKQSEVVFSLLGGKISENDLDKNAFRARDATYWVIILGQWAEGDEKDEAAVRAWVRDTHAKLKPYSAGEYAPLIGKSEQGYDVFGKNFARLLDAKNTYDPENLFQFNRNIVPQTPADQQVAA